jgi:hypothetical protein
VLVEEGGVSKAYTDVVGVLERGCVGVVAYVDGVQGEILEGEREL